jgi:hypothetical protein
MSPLAIILSIIAAAVVISVVYAVQRFNVYKGYEQIAQDARRIGTILKAEIFRDGGDLVISGNQGRFPTVVRFSHSENTPGMNIQMRVPSTFDLSLSPKKVTAAKGRTVVRTGSIVLDSKFSARTDHPTQTKMLVTNKAALAQLEKLCCSTQTDLTLSTGNMELSELAIPAYTGRHVLEHLESMDIVGKLLQEMPGADAVKIEPVRTESSTWLFRGITALGVIVIGILLFTHSGKNASVAMPEAAQPLALEGMAPQDAEHIDHLQGWHVAAQGDFSDGAAQFLRDNDLDVGGHVKGDFGGRGSSLDSAYLLLDNKGRGRVTMLANGMLGYDAIFDHVDVIATVPKENLPNVEWTSSLEAQPDGDALLIVQNISDPASGLILFRHEKQTSSARPVNFNKLDLYSKE